MDIEELKQTEIWELFEQCRNYCRMINMYADTDLNYRMYNGNQWHGLKVSGIEPVQLNFIKPIVKYKIGTINSNLWAVHYSSENFENKDFRQRAEQTCELLNKRASKIWEHDSLDLKVRKISKDAAINDEGIMYVWYDEEEQLPVNERLSKNDVYFGNENDSEIQIQPYILIKQRMPVIEARKLAEREGVSEEKIKTIVGDNDTFEEAGDSGKLEKDNMCTVVTKLYKENGTVHYSRATRYCELKEDIDTGYKYYPVAHMLWEEKEGSARGEGEVRHLIPNQIEVNKTLMRRALTVKNTAYPQKVAAVDKIANLDALDRVGGIIKARGGNVDDVAKVFTTIQPAQMSTDVEKLQNELIQVTRELAGAGDIATGDVDPESASGKAILAVQQAAQQPLVEQLSALKTFIEDLARIWLDLITVHSIDGITLEEEHTDPQTGEEYIELIDVQQSVLLELQATVKVDITPKGAFDKYAQELSLENLLQAGLINLKQYVGALDDDSTMPKQKLEQIVEEQEEEKRRIAIINAEAQLMQQRAAMFLDSDIEAQASTMAEAEKQLAMERQATAQDRNEVAEEREGMAEEREAVDN